MDSRGKFCPELDIPAAASLDRRVRYTDAPARREELVSRLTSAGYVSSAQVAEALGVSEMTIRRDLRRLAAEGLAMRVPGGASLPTSAGAQPFDVRRGTAAVAKRELARAAGVTLGGARRVALDAGTTVAAIVDFLPRPLTVVSHSLPVLIGCAVSSEIELVGLGGQYCPETRCFAGRAARAAMADLDVDVAVLSATAVTARGLFSASEADAEIKQAMVESAGRVVVLADRGKLAAKAAVRFAAPHQVDALLTDAPGDDPRVTVLRDHYAEVVSVGPAADPTTDPTDGQAEHAG
jgi:DeoR/GlpR family transcriptional regulator of sugar metabolism